MGARIFPRPVRGPIRPVVHCPTQKHNMKTRAGKGFTLRELKEAGVGNKRYARTIGIAVDHRRRNHCEESLALNVERLKTYMSKLILYPLNADKVGEGEASAEDV